MRHGVAGRKLGRNASQRKALWRGLITELFRYDRISTTEAKARSMRGDAEHLITVAKRDHQTPVRRGGAALHCARRRLHPHRQGGAPSR
jgi:ribosomal protein L17